jgi:hypothetical protein
MPLGLTDRKVSSLRFAQRPSLPQTLIGRHLQNRAPADISRFMPVASTNR